MWARPLQRLVNPLPYLRPLPAHSIRRIHRALHLPPQHNVLMSSPHKFLKDEIFIDSLSLKCTCGPDAFGRAKPQPVLLSIWLGTSVARAAASDRVDLSIDYSALSKQLTAMQDRKYASVMDLIDHVIEPALQEDGVGRVCVRVDLAKGLLRGRNLRWERTAWMDDGLKGCWQCGVDGLEIPIIIGIDENLHERTQKQIVIVDLKWHGYHGPSEKLETFSPIELVNSVIKVSSVSQC
jgi:FolB domain-containing protein